MVYVRKPKAATSAVKALQPQVQPVALDPVLQKKQQVAHTMHRFTARPNVQQKQLARPTLAALRLYGEEFARVEGARPALQAQVLQQAKSLPPTAVRDALGRQIAQKAPLPHIAAPKSQADWVAVMRQQAAQAEGRLLGQKEVAQYTALQRQVTERLLQGFRQDRQAPAARYAEYAGHLVSLQRHASSGRVAGAFMTLMPQGERPALQRAIDETLQREAQQQAQDDAALSLHSLQRQLAELDQQATQPVYDRIKARRGAGNPLPEAVRRHLEHGLNHDLSAVRIHDDAEADHLSKSVNAVAFTTGTDIFFQSGKFNPNSQNGLELLAHEVTHTVQQGKGRVGKGLDPDAGLENEARDMGRKLASISPRSLMAPVPHVGGPYARGVYNQRDSLARVQAGAAQTALLNPFKALQRQADVTIQRDFVGDKLSELAGQIPGYKPLTMALGYDPVAGKAIQANPNVLLDALGNFVPGPFKDMLKVVREQKLVDKAWTWFKAELGKLQLGKVITDIKDALSGLPNIGKAKNILVSAVDRVKNLVAGSARKLAEIAITAISAGLGPVGKQIMASLSKAGDVITQVLKNPKKFADNLMNALKQGFTGFVDRSGKWIQQGLGDFLTGSANIQIPKNLNVEGVLMTALSLMDLTYDALRGRLVKELGAGSEKKIAFLEQAGGALGQLKGGVGKAPEMKAVASKVGGEVLGGIKTEVTETLIKKGIAKVAQLFNPAGAAIGAIMTAWSTIQTVIDKGKQIMSVIMNALSSIKEIAAGNVAGAANFIEQTVGKALPVVFSFAANFLGIGNIGTRIKNLVRGMRQKLGIDKFIDGIVARLKKLVGAGRAGTTVSNNQSNTLSTDKEHDKAVRAGLDDIPKLEAKYTVNGVLPKNAAKRVAKEVQKSHKIFKKVIAHVNKGQHAQYEWFASHGWEEGAKKLGGRIDVQAELQAAKTTAPANWTAIFATGGKKLQCLPDVKGDTSLTLRRTWQESGRSIRSILDRLEAAMEKTLLASRPALSADAALLELEMQKLAQLVFSKVADRPLFYIKWTDIPRKLKAGPHMIVRDPTQKITKYAKHAKNAMDDTLTGLAGEIHHAVSLYLGGGNGAKNLVAAVGQARIADSAHNILHDILDTSVVTKALSGMADDYALSWSSLAITFNDSTLKVLIGTCADDGDITYKETALEFENP